MAVADQAGADQTGVPDGWVVVTDPAATFHGTNEKDAQGNAVVLPALRSPMVQGGRGTQLNPDKSLAGATAAYNVATTPLAHPTGIDAVDNFTSPVGLASLALGGTAVVRAGLSEGAAAAAKAAAAQTNPVIKFEVARRTMKAVGAPEWLALPVAYYLSGYTKGAKPGPVDPAAPHLDRSVPVQPGALTQEQIAERVFSGQGTPPPQVAKPALGRVRGVRDVIAPDVQPAPPGAAPPDAPAPPAATGDPAVVPPSPPGSAGPPPAPPVTNPLPDQRALNEAALAARRAAYQARVSAAGEADAVAQTPAPARIKLTAPESREYLRLRQAGMTDPQTMEALQAARAFQQRFGTPTPTVAETTFPKR
jgi:hypothetical protein